MNITHVPQWCSECVFTEVSVDEETFPGTLNITRASPYISIPSNPLEPYIKSVTNDNFDLFMWH